MNEFISLTKTQNQSSRNAQTRELRALTGVLSRPNKVQVRVTIDYVVKTDIKNKSC